MPCQAVNTESAVKDDEPTIGFSSQLKDRERRELVGVSRAYLVRDLIAHYLLAALFIFWAWQITYQLHPFDTVSVHHILHIELDS